MSALALSFSIIVLLAQQDMAPTRRRAVMLCPSAPIYGERLGRSPIGAFGSESCLKYPFGARVWRSNDYVRIPFWVVREPRCTKCYVPDAHPEFIFGYGYVRHYDPDLVIEHDISPCAHEDWFLPGDLPPAKRNADGTFVDYNGVTMFTHDGRAFDSMEIETRVGPNRRAWWPYLPCGVDLSRVKYNPLLIED